MFFMCFQGLFVCIYYSRVYLLVRSFRCIYYCTFLTDCISLTCLNSHRWAIECGVSERHLLHQSDLDCITFLVVPSSQGEAKPICSGTFDGVGQFSVIRIANCPVSPLAGDAGLEGNLWESNTLSGKTLLRAARNTLSTFVSKTQPIS
jgi:hypothetical protein